MNGIKASFFDSLKMDEKIYILNHFDCLPLNYKVGFLKSADLWFDEYMQKIPTNNMNINEFMFPGFCERIKNKFPNIKTDKIARTDVTYAFQDRYSKLMSAFVNNRLYDKYGTKGIFATIPVLTASLHCLRSYEDFFADLAKMIKIVSPKIINLQDTVLLTSYLIYKMEAFICMKSLFAKINPDNIINSSYSQLEPQWLSILSGIMDGNLKSLNRLSNVLLSQFLSQEDVVNIIQIIDRAYSQNGANLVYLYGYRHNEAIDVYYKRKPDSSIEIDGVSIEILELKEGVKNIQQIVERANSFTEHLAESYLGKPITFILPMNVKYAFMYESKFGFNITSINNQWSPDEYFIIDKDDKYFKLGFCEKDSTVYAFRIYDDCKSRDASEIVQFNDLDLDGQYEICDKEEGE